MISGAAYPKSLNTLAKKALYDNLGKNEVLALAVDAAVRASKQDEWRSNPFKVKKVMQAIRNALEETQPPGGQEMKETAPPYTVSWEHVLELVKKQTEY